MNKSTFLYAPPSSSSPRESVALIPPRWRPWLRVFWILVALNSIAAFAMTVFLTWEFAQHLPPRIVEGLGTFGWNQDTYFWYNALLLLFHFACFYFIGLSIYWLRPAERMAYFASIFFIAFATANAYVAAPEFLETLRGGPSFYVVSFNLNNLLAWPLLIAFCAVFPDGRFVPRWTRFLAAFGLVITISWGIFPEQFSNPQGAMVLALIAFLLILFGGSFLAQIKRYRHYSTPMQRQQTKWLLYGLALIVLGTLLIPTIFRLILPLAGFTGPSTTVLSDLVSNTVNTLFVLLPLSVGIAILRYRLWDIDILIRKTLTYALVVALLAIVYFGSVILLQQIFANVTGLGSNEIITVISTLAIAALFVPLRNRIQEFIDRRFYRKKYDAQQVLQKFAETVRDETDLEKLTAELVNVVQETMQPTSVSVWLKRTTEDR
ncbi:MAG: hypothetical protein DCC52_14040 [Chloroflexi bacterium]|nr:MAG: hypothetical protein DCC52_14040 [Chloroflexota bacterium]